MIIENTEIYGFPLAIIDWKTDKNDTLDMKYDSSEIDVNLLTVADKWVNYLYPEYNWPEKFSDEGCKKSEEIADKLSNEGRFNYEGDVCDTVYMGPCDLNYYVLLKKNQPSLFQDFLKKIWVSAKISAPSYWWDKYSEYMLSTRSTGINPTKPFTLENFDLTDFDENLVYYSIGEHGTQTGAIGENTVGMFAEFMLEQLNMLREKYNETEDFKYYVELNRWAPQGFLITKRVTFTYAALRDMYQRPPYIPYINTKFSPEVKEWIEGLPYASYFITDKEMPLFEK